MNSLAASLAIGLALVAAGAAAQVVYKSTMPDGKVVYAEKPVPGAKRVDRIDPPPAKTGTTLATPDEIARAEAQARERAATGTTRQSELEDARAQLQKALAARDVGKEPLPGERTGAAGGKSRLAEAYATRQQALEDAVIAARKRLEDAQRGR